MATSSGRATSAKRAPRGSPARHRSPGDARVYGDARAKKPLHVYSISGPITPNADNATLMRLKGGKHLIRIGCWEGTVKELRTLAASDHWPSGGDAEYRDQWRQSLLDVADLFDRRRKMWRTA